MARVKIFLGHNDTQIEINGERIEDCVRKIVVTAEVDNVTSVNMVFYPSEVEITGEAIDTIGNKSFLFKRERN